MYKSDYGIVNEETGREYHEMHYTVIIISTVSQKFRSDISKIAHNGFFKDWQKKVQNVLAKNTWLTEGTKLLNCEAMDIWPRTDYLYYSNQYLRNIQTHYSDNMTRLNKVVI